MEIIYRKEIGFIYDICVVAVFLSNDRKKWEDLAYIDDVLSYFKKISFSTKLLGVKLEERRGSLLSELYREYIESSRGGKICAKEFGAYLTDSDKLKKMIIDRFFTEEEIGSDKEILEKISLSDYSMEIKSELYDAILFPQRYAIRVKCIYENLCEAMGRVYEKYYDDAKKDRVMEFLNHPEGTHFEHEYYDWIYQQGKCYVGFCIVWRYGVLLGQDYDNEHILIFGIDYEEEAGQRIGSLLSLETFANAICDKIRISIIQAIRIAGELSLIQIAECLRLSNTVVMYHLNVLKKAKVLLYRTNGRSVMYRINKDILINASEEIRKLAQ